MSDRFHVSSLFIGRNSKFPVLVNDRVSRSETKNKCGSVLVKMPFLHTFLQLSRHLLELRLIGNKLHPTILGFPVVSFVDT